MKKPLLLIWCLLVGLAVIPKSAFAGGFELYEHDAKAAAMQNAFVAQANTPSAIYYNPAGMTQLEGTQLLCGANFYFPSATFESNGTSAFGAAGKKTDLETQTFIIPQLFVTHKLNEDLSVGLGGFINFGLGTQWPTDWEGRYITGGTKAEVKTFTIEPAVAYRPIKQVSIGFGPFAEYFDVTLENKIPQTGAPATDLSSKLNGSSWQFGWNLGVLVWITDELKFGANYRSSAKQSISGNAEITGTALSPVTQAILGKYDAEADITLPPIGNFGLAYEKQDWTVEADLYWTGWTTYDKLAVTIKNFPAGNPDPISKNWKDTWAYRFGGEYRMDETWSFRAGFSLEKSPIPATTLDPLMPSGDRRYYSLGVGAKFDLLTVDLAYIYLTDDAGKFDNEVADYATEFGKPPLGRMTGKFQDVTAHILCVNLRYQL
ncbi:MAG: hypothetical protein HGB19_09715 [Chlorobiales bacterium]|nr:hypothetical protein [Chlorobiales bacterium]